MGIQTSAWKICIVHKVLNLSWNFKDLLKESFLYAFTAAAKSLQSCQTLCDPTDGSPPGSSVPGILQVRPLEWVAISFSNAWKGKGGHSVMSDSSRHHGRAAHQASPSMAFSRQQYWSGVPSLETKLQTRKISEYKSRLFINSEAHLNLPEVCSCTFFPPNTLASG